MQVYYLPVIARVSILLLRQSLNLLIRRLNNILTNIHSSPNHPCQLPSLNPPSRPISIDGPDTLTEDDFSLGGDRIEGYGGYCVTVLRDEDFTCCCVEEDCFVDLICRYYDGKFPPIFLGEEWDCVVLSEWRKRKVGTQSSSTWKTFSSW